MFEILENEKGKLVAKGKYGEETIHIIHCSETIEELKDELADLFIVSEEATNFARTHLVADFSKDEALQQVATYLFEEEEIDEPHLIGVFEAKLIDMNFEIIDDTGTIYSGTKEKMEKAFFVMVHLFETIQEKYNLTEEQTRDLVDEYPGAWKGDLKLVEIHKIER